MHPLDFSFTAETSTLVLALGQLAYSCSGHLRAGDDPPSDVSRPLSEAEKRRVQVDNLASLPSLNCSPPADSGHVSPRAFIYFSFSDSLNTPD